MMRWLRPPEVFDLLALVGAVLMAVGLWQVWPPSCLLAVGAGLVMLALHGAQGTAERQQEPRRRRRKQRIEFFGERRSLGRDTAEFAPSIDKGHLVTFDEDDSADW